MKEFEEKKPTTEEMEDWTEKNGKKKWIILFSVIGLLVAALGAYYTYFYIYLNTEHYIDNVKETLKTSMNNYLKTVSETQDDYYTTDLTIDSIIKGNFNLTNAGKEIMSFDMDLASSPKKETTSIDARIKKAGNTLFTGSLCVQDNAIYIDSKDLFNQTLSMDIESSLAKNTEKLQEVNDLLVNARENIQYVFEKMIEYYLEAMKEGELSTKPNGINKKEYIIKVGTSEKVAIERRLKDLIKKDEKLTKIIEAYNIEYDLIETGTYKIGVDVFTNELKSFEIITDDGTLTGEYDGEKFILTDETGDYVYVWFNEDEIRIEEYENKVLTGNLLLNKEQITFSYEDVLINFEVQQENKETELKLEFKTEDVEMNFTAKYKMNDNKEEINGSGSIIAGGETLGLTFTLESEQKEDLVEKKQIENAKNYTDLTEAEQEEILGNLYILLDKFGLYDSELF